MCIWGRVRFAQPAMCIWGRVRFTHRVRLRIRPRAPFARSMCKTHPATIARPFARGGRANNLISKNILDRCGITYRQVTLADA